MARKYNIGKRLQKGYDAYLRNRETWISKGYGMDEALSFETFTKEYNRARKRGDKNIARTFAEMDRTYTKRESKILEKAFEYQEGDSEAITKIKDKYHTADGEMLDIWKLKGRAGIFEDLADVTGSFDKAEKVLY